MLLDVELPVLLDPEPVLELSSLLLPHAATPTAIAAAAATAVNARARPSQTYIDDLPLSTLAAGVTAAGHRRSLPRIMYYE
ncbi:MAG TPA: hypothetical protein VGM91_04135 [Conexibacter sp.]|jgi:hypothetical protein